uniref:NADH-ubiquinone oxidoreductase chain 3 n=1 Tax=Opistholeptus burmanus TaxID=2813440 RepID=A0A8T9ZWH5_9HEMI|nr:NADH dehydrogenase subunit 3 [Opistholeptus burmanus]
MFKIMLSMMIIALISVSLMSLCTMISKKSMMDREKLSPFECGFNPMSSARTPFSLQFFLIAVLFLIFDIEIVIMLPMINTLEMSNPMLWTMTTTFMITILIMGLYYEWMNSMLEWAK